MTNKATFFFATAATAALENSTCDPVNKTGLIKQGPALFTKTNKVIEKITEFMVEAGVFEAPEFSAGCFLFTTRTRLPLQHVRYRATPALLAMGTSRNLAVSHDQLGQADPADPGGKTFMDNAG